MLATDCQSGQAIPKCARCRENSAAVVVRQENLCRCVLSFIPAVAGSTAYEYQNIKNQTSPSSSPSSPSLTTQHN